LLSFVKNNFDLHKGPLYRFKLLRISKNVYRFISVFHHIVIDGACLESGFFRLLSRYFNDKCFTPEYGLRPQEENIKLSHKKLTSILEPKNRSSPSLACKN